jgi:vitamin B12 transporter
MFNTAHRAAVSRLLRYFAIPFGLCFLFLVPADGVIVRGRVTGPLGAPVANARVQLIQGQKVAAFIFTGFDGSYEIRSVAPGRFVLLTSALSFTPNVSRDFYGGRTAIVSRDVVMESASVTSKVSLTATGLPTPIPQLGSAVTLIPQTAWATEVGVLNVLRQTAGSEVVRTGQIGGEASLFVRGGASDANEVVIDGIPATDLGGRFDYGTLSTLALDGAEVYRGANSALYGSGAEASVVRLTTGRGGSLRPVLDYTGDAGNFHTSRNEAALSGAHNKLDYYGAFSRFDTSNALPLDQDHSSTSVANLGYSILSNTQARFTLRNTDTASGLPGANDIYGISASGKRADQDIYSGFTVENQFAGNWHNLARYGIVRRREQVEQFAPTGQPVTTVIDGVPHTSYYGNLVSLRGANGYVASGQAAFFNPAGDSVSNRDELYYQTDYTFPHRIAALFSFRYESERGRLLDPGASLNEQSHRTNFLYTLQVQGDIKHRFFYSLGGAVQKNHIYGVAGTPRIGLSYSPVRPGRPIFRGTRLRANVATGVQEPSLEAEFTSLYTQLRERGNNAAISAYNVSSINAMRSRTYDFGVDQNILNQKLILKAGYFHNQFNHQLELINADGLEEYFGIPAGIATQLPEASLNSLAYRTQGLEVELQYQPFTHLVLDGGYTYLASLVSQSFASDAVAANNGTPVTNPDLPGIAIGALSPLVGSRPFRRPPSTGFFAVEYSASRFSAGFKGALASRSDDSTFQLQNDINGGNSLLLPNRNLDFGYAKLDMNALLTASHHVSVFTQLDNLLGQQHIGPIGYSGLPFTFRAGLKIRVGGN